MHVPADDLHRPTPTEEKQQKEFDELIEEGALPRNILEKGRNVSVEQEEPGGPAFEGSREIVQGTEQSEVDEPEQSPDFAGEGIGEPYGIKPIIFREEFLCSLKF